MWPASNFQSYYWTNLFKILVETVVLYGGTPLREQNLQLFV